MSLFKLHSRYRPAGDQPAAIAALLQNLRGGCREQILRGVTGSGNKPAFTLMANCAPCDGILNWDF